MASLPVWRLVVNVVWKSWTNCPASKKKSEPRFVQVSLTMLWARFLDDWTSFVREQGEDTGFCSKLKMATVLFGKSLWESRERRMTSQNL